MWTASVRRQFEAAHHNGPPGHRCNKNHGHSWVVVIVFRYSKLDANGWGPDFGAVKKLLDSTIINKLDHQDLNELLPFPPSAELLAQWIFTTLFVAMPTLFMVEVQEGGGNAVQYRPD